jgi:outer membrane immunogenic protein
MRAPPLLTAIQEKREWTSMKLRSFAFACLLSLGAVPAMAADLPARMVTKAPALMMSYNWTGFYLGANVGYAWGRTTGTLAGPGANFDIDGAFGGGQLGANYQVGNWVFGVEVDYQGGDINGSNAVSNVKVDSFGTVRGRLGYAWDRWMVYGTGGYAFDGHTKATFPGIASDSRSLDGWAAGAGIEYAFLPNWSAKLEYLHVDLGEDTFFPAACAPTSACQSGVQFDSIRAGVNYRFWGGR